MRINYFVEPSLESLARRAAEHVTSVIEEAVANHGRARVAISGGSTPKALYRLLAAPGEPWRSRIPLDKLDIYWVDERAVPPTYPESNYRMTCEAWLDHVPLAPSRIHRIEGEAEPRTAALRYESELRNSFSLGEGELPRFDLVALGMGTDGHTASLFPFTAVLGEQSRLVVACQPPQQSAWRVTLTVPVINNSSSVFFLVAGEDKAEILNKVFSGPYSPQRFPSQLISPAGSILTVLLDQAAAALLPAIVGRRHGYVESER